MDPEDWRSVVNEAFERLAPHVRRYDGRIAQYLGDGFLALFGTPRAHEDDAVRAALASLDILEEARAFAADVRARSGIDFGVRLGLDSGPVVVGDVGEVGAGEHLAIGDAVNAAARLQALAEPMTVLASEALVRALGGRLAVEDRGPQWLKGRSRAVRAYRIVGRVVEHEVGAAGREHAHGTIVGRAAELHELLVAAEAIADGQTTSLAIVGEPGIGKSRLLAEWRAAVEQRGVRWVEVHGRAYGGETAHQLLVSLLGVLVGVASEDGPASFIRSVDDAVGAATPGAGAILAEIVWPGSQAEGPSDPRGRLLARRRALRALVDGLASRGPIAIALEDVHWADPASVGVIETLVSPAERGVALGLTARVEPDTPGWRLVEAVQALSADRRVVLELGPLTADESTRLVGQMLPGAPPPAGMAAAIWRRAEGNPLFVEQLVRSLVDDGAVRQGEDGWVETQTVDVEAIPATLHGLLLARIDRLGEASRTALRVGSVIGRRFDAALLARVASAARMSLPATLDEPLAAGLVEQLPKAPGAPDAPDVFAFRHALVQEAAYGSLLRADRAQLHRAVARTLAAAAPGRLAELAPALAFHHRRAGDLGPAIRWSVVAGGQARLAHANAEALAHLDEALALLADLPERRRRARRAAEREALEGRGDVLGWLQRRDESLAAYEAAEALLPRGPSLDLARLARKRAGILTSGQRVDEALEAFAVAERILGPDEPSDDAARREWVQVHLDRANCHYFQGDVEAILRDREVIAPYIEHRGTSEERLAFLHVAISLAFRRDGYRIDDQTLALERRALELAHDLGDPSREAVQAFSLGLTLLTADRLDEVDELFDRSLATADACDDELLVARIHAYRPLLSRKRGDVESTRASAAVALETATRLRLPEYRALAIANQAWVARRDGNAAGARERAKEAIRLWDTGEFSYPFHWVALLPVLDLDLGARDIDAAVGSARRLLDPRQQPLPAPLERSLVTAVRAWDVGRPDRATTALHGAVEAARALGYL
jgi:class 3 adenylate cyclase/tetratricopeptide (TPR) repeat protein